ncbi:hypothetical protein B5M42_022945 [Paenibacillus athensensis]|uniref:Copper amine oxidase-like N-terminal domain-containing protein n=1 Tax=Paenibacillus athensensis TaxID=1967502 RepID=A0A4Y8PRC4_9BACL|nr:hypothetical protein [Paenibacillus athensensis]MCD1261666.1 hypothetical protein [Paenibacillus athensensis]
MRKYVIGAAVGFVLSLSLTAHAEVEQVMNAVVQGLFPVKVDGVRVGDAIVVNDKTYLPVRSFGEAVGYEVTFTDAREVVMTRKAATPDPDAARQAELMVQIGKLESDIQSKQAGIQNMKQSIENFTFEMDRATDDTLKFQFGAQITQYQARIQEWQNVIIELQKQVDALRQQLPQGKS